MPDIQGLEKKIDELNERLKKLEALFILPVHQRTDSKDELYDQARELVIKHKIASASFLQRKLVIGYARAAKILDDLQAGGVVGPFSGSSSRKVLVKA